MRQARQQIDRGLAWAGEQAGSVLGLGVPGKDSQTSAPPTIANPIQTSSTPASTEHMVNADGQVMPKHNVTDYRPPPTNEQIREIFERLKSGEASPENVRKWNSTTQEHANAIEKNPVSSSGNAHSLWAPSPDSSVTAKARLATMMDQYRDLQSGQITEANLKTFQDERKPFAEMFVETQPQLLDKHHGELGKGRPEHISGIHDAVQHSWFGIKGRIDALNEMFPGEATASSVPPAELEELKRSFSKDRERSETYAAKLSQLIALSGGKY